MKSKHLYLGVLLLVGLVLFALIDRSDPGDQEHDTAVEPEHHPTPFRRLPERSTQKRHDPPIMVSGYATSRTDGTKNGSLPGKPEGRAELRRSEPSELDEETADLLDDLQGATDTETKILTIGRLTKSVSIPEVTEVMLQLANDPDARVRSALLGLFHAMRGPDVMPTLARMAREDPSRGIRQRANQLNGYLSRYQLPTTP